MLGASASDSSSDDENVSLLLEAADPEFINDAMYKLENKALSSVIVLTELPPSLRPVEDDQAQFNLFNVTPQFQNHVASHLTKLLDKQIKYYDTDSNISSNNKTARNGGVRLFKNSTNRLKITRAKETKYVSPSKRKQIIKRQLTDECCELVLKDVAISGDDILKQKGVAFWSRRSKAPVFNYRKDKMGVLVYVQPEFK